MGNNICDGTVAEIHSTRYWGGELGASVETYTCVVVITVGNGSAALLSGSILVLAADGGLEG